MIILCIFNINYILLEISGSHSNIISDSYVFHYGNELVSRTGIKGIRHFVTTNYDQKYPFASVMHSSTGNEVSRYSGINSAKVSRYISTNVLQILGLTYRRHYYS